MTPTTHEQLEMLGRHLRSRREAVLTAWRASSERDPAQTTVYALTRSQFDDHIPGVLDAFERALLARPGEREAQAANRQQHNEEVKHGLERWQQGYKLHEVIHEWGHLQTCLFEEVDTFARRTVEFTAETLAVVNRQWIVLVNEGISESVSQYERLQRAEAAGRVRDMELALAQVNEVERSRAALIHQAVHDLRGDVQGLNLAASLLGETGIQEAERIEFSGLLKQGTHAVATMLGELMDLARLEAGQERRELATFDAAGLLKELALLSTPLARTKQLYLETSGPAELPVEGDAGKVRRVVQNLLVNALKYTREGGVVVSWGADEKTWWCTVKDTGPGLLGGPGTPMAAGLQEATASARETDEKSAALTGDAAKVLAAIPTESVFRPWQQQAGEGIGLSIVKRICELLDASLEMASSAEKGTTFRVVWPRNYSLFATAGSP